MLLRDKVAVVTGAASAVGIGRATARRFAEEGARVALLDLAETDPAAAAAELGSDHAGYACDVRDRDACRATLKAVVADFGGLDILVGNAGVVFGTPLADIEPAEYDLVMDVNLRGNFHMAQAAAPHMKASRIKAPHTKVGGGGAMVLVSSIAGQVGGGLFGRSHYAAAKAGIFGLAKALARELAADGIRVNAVAPGVIDNDFTRGRMTPDDKARIAGTVPLGRLGTPEDVAGSCLYLASDLSAYVTGSVLSVNGGLHMA
jgi:NAD(P)-dependent dehydrogenase (short-subunit alcohol dehydrogenase family)